MWKDYSSGYIKNNRASGVSVMAASFIAALFLSWLCGLFYHFWLDNIEAAKQEFGGGWQGRIVGDFSAEDLLTVNQFPNVESAAINEELTGEQGTVLDIYFQNKRTVYRDMLALLDRLGLEESAADYNYQLLSLYFIRIPGDTKPRMIMPLYLAIVAVVCFSLILIIHNSFAVSMGDRIHQFGIFSSIGATPGQIRICLVQEALVLSLAPILGGILLGTAACYGTLRAMSLITEQLVGGREIAFQLNLAVLAFLFLLSLFTVLLSAWLPARKLSRLTPLEAIRGTGEFQLKAGKGLLSRKHSRVLSLLFGMEGELAGNALRAQKKALRTTSLSLTLAFLGFLIMENSFTLMGISTEQTYFARYQNVWDIMVTVKDTGIEAFGETEALKALPGAEDTVVYQKAQAVCRLPEGEISQELSALGGPQSFMGGSVRAEEGFLLIPAPLIILDDQSFEGYCEQIGVPARLDGCILLNQFWDSKNSNFRAREYVPYVREGIETVMLQNAGQITGVEDRENGISTAELSVIACTMQEPVLREEYATVDNSELVQFISLSAWKEIAGHIGGTQRDTFVRVLAEERTELASLDRLEAEIGGILSGKYETESENRIREKLDNDKMIDGYMLILGAFCVLIAIIGIANVFANTLGFLRRRKREFARYLSVGLTPEGIRKMFRIEALVLAGRPMLFSLVLTVLFTGAMVTASHLEIGIFLAEAPVLPCALFLLAAFGCVALAYGIGGRRVLKLSLVEALRDDTIL